MILLSNPAGIATNTCPFHLPLGGGSANWDGAEFAEQTYLRFELVRANCR